MKKIIISFLLLTAFTLTSNAQGFYIDVENKSGKELTVKMTDGVETIVERTYSSGILSTYIDPNIYGFVSILVFDLNGELLCNSSVIMPLESLNSNLRLVIKRINGNIAIVKDTGGTPGGGGDRETILPI